MKIIITGRRAANQSWVEMKRHMLDVHGPLVAEQMPGCLSSYVQNQVRDGRYGEKAPAGRDMVAEVMVAEGAIPEKPQAVIDDEVRFAHQSDLFPLLTSETVVVTPPAAAGRTDAPRGFKVLCYLAPSAGVALPDFIAAWDGLDSNVSAITGLTGYVKSVVLPISPPASPYKGVVGLWFQPDLAEDGLTAWYDLIIAAGVVNTDLYFCVYVDEHRII